MGTRISFIGLLMAGAMLTPTSVFSQEKSDGATDSSLSAPSPVPMPYFTSVTEVSAENGRLIYSENCAVCHGLFGRGDGPRVSSFGEYQYIPDLSDGYVIEGRDEEIIEEISEGLNRLEPPAIIMPQFKYILARSDIESVLEYLKVLPEIAPPLIE